MSFIHTDYPWGLFLLEMDFMNQQNIFFLKDRN